MRKHDILEDKLKKISEHIEGMELKDEISLKYLCEYKGYVDKLICATHNKTIRESDGAMLGLIRGISDYDEICADEMLWNLVKDADNNYSQECKFF